MRLLNILRSQAEVYRDIFEKKLMDAKSSGDIKMAHAEALRGFYTRAFKPTLDGYTRSSIDSSSMNDMMDKASTDICVAYEQIDKISDEISDAFNSNQEYKTSLRNRVEYLSSIVEDINLMAEENLNNTVVFKDSLTSYDFIDRGYGQGTLANISTAEGVAYLSVSRDENLNALVQSIKVSGNGTSGNYYTTKKVNIESFNDAFNSYIKYKSDEDAHADPLAISDNEASTWYEYQMLGIEPSSKTTYRIGWGNADKIEDELVLKVDIELKKVSDINWMDIIPYMPERSKANITLYSVRVSEDGSNYSPIYKGEPIINKSIYSISQSYDKESLFSKDNLAKFTSQGVLNFPRTKAKFIEVILKQTKPYDESLGAIVYTKYLISGGKEINKGIIEEQMVPAFIVQGPVGKYKISNSEYITKEMVALEGWRYAIGLRGIDLYNKSFSSQSEIVTKRFETKKPIRKIMLYSNEIIPEDFNKYGIDMRNDWIKYYISINDIDWHRISPMHHNQIGNTRMAPKIFEVNGSASSDEKSINKGYLESSDDAYSVRLKIVFSGSGENGSATPILEEYAIKCVTEGGVE